MTETLFSLVVAVVRALEVTTKRLEKRRTIADFLRTLGRDEVSPAVRILIGRIFPEAGGKVLNVGWATLSKAMRGARQATLDARPLTILEVARTFDGIAAASGPDSARARRRLLDGLLGRAAEDERDVLLRTIFGEMRHGVVEGVMLEAIADSAEVDAEAVRTANMFLGDVGRTAEVALFEGESGLARQSLQLLSPVKPMMAEMASDAEQILREHGGRTALEWKFDGARIQIHRRRDEVKVFSRRLTDVTDSLPEVVEFALSLPVESVLVEGEVVAVDAVGRPLPFQDLMRRFRRVHDVDALRKEIPLRLYLFDLLYLNGRDFVREPYTTRWEALAETVPAESLAPRRIVSSPDETGSMLREALEAGHEGLMAKQLDAPYVVGKRRKRWFKLKLAETLDVAILAAEWGSGRRKGTLSNYHLGVRHGDGWAMIGKTFKGLTDRERRDVMERLLELKASDEPWGVVVRPELIVEVAYNEIQRSPHYESGFALRFARITRVRWDKGPADADTHERLSELYQMQFERKGKYGRDGTPPAYRRSG